MSKQLHIKFLSYTFLFLTLSLVSQSASAKMEDHWSESLPITRLLMNSLVEDEVATQPILTQDLKDAGPVEQVHSERPLFLMNPGMVTYSKIALVAVLALLAFLSLQKYRRKEN